MATLREVWLQLGVDKIDREGLKNFLQKLSISLEDNEVNKIFTILDIEKSGYLSYDDIRIFFTMTKVYDKSKYPKPKVRRSYKIHPE